MRPFVGIACAHTIWRSSSTAWHSVSTLDSNELNDSDARAGAPLFSAATDTVVDELTLEVHRRPVAVSVAQVPAKDVLVEEVVDVSDAVPDVDWAAGLAWVPDVEPSPVDDELPDSNGA